MKINIKSIALTLIMIFLSELSFSQSPLALDKSFNFGLTKNYGFNYGYGANEEVYSIKSQSDGKIIIVGNFTAYNGVSCNRIARLNTDGSIDKAFNIGLGANKVVKSAEIQADGKIVIIGEFSSFDNNHRSYIARLKSDGSLDNGFNVSISGLEEISTIKCLPDGKILIGAHIGRDSENSGYTVIKLNANGRIDTDFNFNSEYGGKINTINLYSDGKILVGRNFNDDRSFFVKHTLSGNIDSDFSTIEIKDSQIQSVVLQGDGSLLVSVQTEENYSVKCSVKKFMPNGYRDFNFNILIGLGSPHNQKIGFFAGLISQTDGKLIVYKEELIDYHVKKYCIFGINQEGVLDSSFRFDSLAFLQIGINGFNLMTSNEQGEIILAFKSGQSNELKSNLILKISSNGKIVDEFKYGIGSNGSIYSLLEQPDGKILVVGDFTCFNGLSQYLVTRLNVDGSIDKNFNVNRTNISNLAKHLFYPNYLDRDSDYFDRSFPGENDKYYYERYETSMSSTVTGFGESKILCILLQPDGKILLGGDFKNFNQSNNNYLVRLNSDGSLDTSFNIGLTLNAKVNSIAIQYDGKILVGGDFNVEDGIGKNYLVRINSDGTIDNSFDCGLGPNEPVRKILVLSNSRILISGDFYRINNIDCGRVAKLDYTGKLDSKFNVGKNINSSVKDMILQKNGKIIIIGKFVSTNYYRIGRNNIARLNVNGSLDRSFALDKSFNPFVSADVSSLISAAAVNNLDKVYVIGKFINSGKSIKNFIICLNPDGVLQNYYVFTENNNFFVNNILLQNNRFVLGGNFTSFNLFSAPNIIGLSDFDGIKKIKTK